MAKPIANPQKWSRDDFRLLVVLLLTIIYPLFVASFYALYVFTLLPVWVASDITILQAHHEGWYHYYWLVMALFWIFLCAVILPCFWDEDSSTQQQLITMSESGGPSYPVKAENVQPPFIHVEESVSKKRVSVLSIKSRKSSDLTLEKEVFQEGAERKSLEKSRESLEKSRESLDKSRESLDKSRESLDKSKESLDKSCSSHERARLTQSGEFLNDFIDSIQSEKQDTKAECEVHVEEKESSEDTLDTGDTGKEVKDDGKKTAENSNQDTSDSQNSDSSDSSEGEADEPAIIPERNEAKILEATQEKINETEALADKPETLEEMDNEPEMRKRARPTIDTSSSASELYECSMPTPLSAEAKRPESNMVFLFVNPESAGTKEDVIIEHEGEVTPADPDKEGKDIIN